ncbi:MAG: RNA 2',3'-cyclic phosphodiesterase [Sandaracinaceae bacterium]
MRIFFALALPEDVRAACAALRRPLEGARWIAPELLHLTLRFLGEIDDASVARLSFAVAARAAPIAPFEVELAGMGTFGRPARVVYLRAWPRDRLERLAHAVDSACLSEGAPQDPKPFRPHVTIARLRAAPDRSELDALRSDAATFVRRFQAEHVHLVRSTLRSDGPTYETLEELPLGASLPQNR